MDALAADVYWIRALQHYGGDRLSKTRERKYEQLYPLLDLTTSLDPYFTIAYRFGAIFLSEAYPGGPGRPDQAIALLRKGIEAQPTKWQYYHDIAFVHYWQLQDMGGAARWFRMAAAQPGAPNWLEPVAASMPCADSALRVLVSPFSHWVTAPGVFPAARAMSALLAPEASIASRIRSAKVMA